MDMLYGHAAALSLWMIADHRSLLASSRLSGPPLDIGSDGVIADVAVLSGEGSRCWALPLMHLAGPCSNMMSSWALACGVTSVHFCLSKICRVTLVMYAAGAPGNQSDLPPISATLSSIPMVSATCILSGQLGTCQQTGLRGFGDRHHQASAFSVSLDVVIAL